MSKSVAVSAVRVAVVQLDPQLVTQNRPGQTKTVWIWLCMRPGRFYRHVLQSPLMEPGKTLVQPGCLDFLVFETQIDCHPPCPSVTIPHF